MGWACTFTIDDVESENLARKKLYDIIHLNQEIITPEAETEKLKRELPVIITSASGVHDFNAIVDITFKAMRNSIGIYTISLTDDGE